MKTIDSTNRLFKACERGHFLKAKTICTEAKKKNTEIDLHSPNPDYSDLNPLAIAIASSLTKHINKRCRFITFLLTDQGLNINQTFKENFSYLQIAILYGDIETVKLLLDIPGLNINHQDNCGQTALHWAFLLRNIEIIILLITKIPNMNLQDHWGKNPMGYSRWLSTNQSITLVCIYCTAVAVDENKHSSNQNQFFNSLSITQEKNASYEPINYKSL